MTLVFSVASYASTADAVQKKPVERRVCYSITEKGKSVQKCRVVKIHKKFAGKQLPKK